MEVVVNRDVGAGRTCGEEEGTPPANHTCKNGASLEFTTLHLTRWNT
jgi:hypothetical protein